ncbi:unnamed protein product [Ceutorhynchus assimilis]|uniref:Uncharacterized protein n=1 Tax=Ceutorhynchus assimilis TaxID=467358 RepID=A0A9N9QNT7_9CUCU|nr:unnamed protein product [Ceutorhynchus assimilis]
MAENAKFKCCKNKDLKFFVCIVCTEIYHQSCVDRRNSVKVIGGHRILCSKKCEQEQDYQKASELALQQKFQESQMELQRAKEALESFHDSYVEKDQTLKKQNLELVQQLDAKESFLRREMRKSQSFHDDALESEKEYQAKISHQREDTPRKLQTLKEAEIVFKAEVLENPKLNRQMVDSMRALEAQSDFYVAEIGRLRDELKQHAIGQQPSCHSESLVSLEAHPVLEAAGKKGAKYQERPNYDTADGGCRKKKQPRILILSDDNGRDLEKFLGRSPNNCEYDVLNIFKPGTPAQSVIEDINMLTVEFTFRDYVILILGSNDLAMNRKPSFGLILSALKSCTHTNVGVLSVPHINGYASRNNKIFEVNKRLYGLICKLSGYSEGKLCFIDYNSRKGIKNSRKDVCKDISQFINSELSYNRNLIFIDTGNRNEYENILEESEILNVRLNGCNFDYYGPVVMDYSQNVLNDSFLSQRIESRTQMT